MQLNLLSARIPTQVHDCKPYYVSLAHDEQQVTIIAQFSSRYSCFSRHRIFTYISIVWWLYDAIYQLFSASEEVRSNASIHVQNE